MPRVEKNMRKTERINKGCYSFASTHINVCEPNSWRRILWYAKSCKRFLNLYQMSIGQGVDSKGWSRCGYT